MYLVVVQVEIKPGESEKFIEGFAAYREIVKQNEPRTVQFELLESALNSGEQGGVGHFTIFEAYEDKDALDVHVASPYRDENVKKLHAYISSASGTHYTSVE